MTSPSRSCIAVALLVVGATVGAQETTRSEARWQAWYGCWSAAPADSVVPSARIVCMTPTSSPDVVEIVAIADGKVAHRDTIDASGREQKIEADGCIGTQRARWSSDGRRVFLTAQTTCSGASTSTGAVLAMTPFGEWLDIRSVTSAGRSAVNIARYRDVGLSGRIPLEVVEAIRSYGPNIEPARVASGVPIPAGAVVEASKIVDAAVLEAWVTQSGLEFVTDARSLRELADAGVAEQVTDAMVAVEANSRDVYDRWAHVPPHGWQAGDYWDQDTGQRIVFRTWTEDPWGHGVGLWRFGREYTRYVFGGGGGWARGLYGSSQWGFVYPFSPMGMSTNRVGSLLPPVLVLHNDPTNTAPRGRSKPDVTEKTEKAAEQSESIAEKAAKALVSKATGAKQAASSRPAPRS